MHFAVLYSAFPILQSNSIFGLLIQLILGNVYDISQNICLTIIEYSYIKSRFIVCSIVVYVEPTLGPDLLGSIILKIQTGKISLVI